MVSDLNNDHLKGAVVRAIDVGYGNVKYVCQHKDAFGIVECDIFPSRSPIAGDKGLSAGFLKGRDTVVIEVNGKSYEVGKGVAMAQGTFDVNSVLDKNFSLSDEHLARLRGALYYMMGSDKNGTKYFNGNHVDYLMVGLPVANYRFKELRANLRNLLVGQHLLPDGRSVVVDSVWVSPQPLGAFFEYSLENDMFDTMSHQSNLIIDPGYFTFDWLFCEGLIPNDTRSDSVNRGVSAVIRKIAEFANEKEDWGADVGMLTRMLDDHFRDGRPFVVYGKEYDVANYLSAGQSVINEAVAQLVNSVGDGADIHNIILAGGGASLYRDAIQAKYHRHQVLIMNSPVYSNVRGFQLAAEQKVINKLRNARLDERVTA